MHFHKCQCCGERIECGGSWEPNPDGFPEVVCSAYHLAGLNQCNTCAIGDCPRCGDCPQCDGRGEIEVAVHINAPTEAEGGMHEQSKHVECDACHGTGRPTSAKGEGA